MKVGNFDIEKGEKSDSKGPTFGKRHLQVILLFFLITLSTCTRLNLSVTMNAMTDSSLNENPNIPTYDWDNKRIILSSFFWGFGVFQIIGTHVGRVYGIKVPMAIAMFINCVAFVLIPPAVEQYGSGGLIMCRVVQGLAQGFFFPSIQSLIGQWIPPTERLTSCVLALSGSPFSGIVTNLFSSYISSTSNGWPITYYILGVLGFLWIIPWTLFGCNCPAEHRNISDGEKTLIHTSLGIDENTNLAKTPWMKILTSFPVWAAIIAYLGQTWGNIIIQTEIPTYMTLIMKLDITSNSYLAATPFVATFLMAFVFCFIANHLIWNKYVPKLLARKLFTSIGMVVPAIAVIVLGYLPENAKICAYLLLLIAAGASSAMYSGHSANIFDLSPTFPGVIKGVSNTISNIFNILTPLTVGIIVTDETDQNYWRIIFLISTTCYISTNIFFFIFASGDLESWDPTSDKMKKDLAEK